MVFETCNMNGRKKIKEKKLDIKRCGNFFDLILYRESHEQNFSRGTQ